MSNEDTREVIVDKNMRIMISSEGAMMFRVPLNPNPKRPTLAHHNYAEEQLEWIRANKDKGINLGQE